MLGRWDKTIVRICELIDWTSSVEEKVIKNIKYKY